MIERREGSFAGARGERLFRQSWRDPSAPARGVLVLVHGLGDHSGLYPTVVDRLVPRGWPVHAFDLRGNGRSPGQRAYVERWRDFRGDLDAFLDVVRAEEPERPLVLLGNSLGGLVALEYALCAPGAARLAGVVAVAAPLGPLGVPRALLLLARMLSRVWPRYSRSSTGLDLTGLARDERVIAAALADPLFHRAATARLATETEAAIARVQALAPSLALPTLLLHGGDDRMVPPDGARAFAERARTAPGGVTYREYPGGYHALLADTGHEPVLDDLERWLPSPGPSPWS
jgi:alpha-beta hydrolase superfamily lysophospholipase